MPGFSSTVKLKAITFKVVKTTDHIAGLLGNPNRAGNRFSDIGICAMPLEGGHGFALDVIQAYIDLVRRQAP